MEALTRVMNYISRRKKSTGIDIDAVHAFDIGAPSFAELRLGDMETIATALLAAEAENARLRAENASLIAKLNAGTGDA